jgi:hypothetical protein
VSDSQLIQIISQNSVGLYKKQNSQKNPTFKKNRRKSQNSHKERNSTDSHWIVKSHIKWSVTGNKRQKKEISLSNRHLIIKKESRQLFFNSFLSEKPSAHENFSRFFFILRFPTFLAHSNRRHGREKLFSHLLLSALTVVLDFISSVSSGENYDGFFCESFESIFDWKILFDAISWQFESTWLDDCPILSNFDGVSPIFSC